MRKTVVPHGWGVSWGDAGPHPVYDAPDDPIFARSFEEAMAVYAQPDPCPDAVIDYGHPLIRCQYCGGYDTSLTSCPHCAAPRHWR